jgi:hypothetical protein
MGLGERFKMMKWLYELTYFVLSRKENSMLKNLCYVFIHYKKLVVGVVSI